MFEGYLGAYESEVTSQPRPTAALHIREPRKPFPPATTIFFLAVDVAAVAACAILLVYRFWVPQVVVVKLKGWKGYTDSG